MPPLEADQKVLVSTSFLNTTHGSLDCVSCHGGVEPASTRKEAHQGLVARPSATANSICAKCHQAETAKVDWTLHQTSAGIVDLKNGVLAPRVNPEKLNVLQPAVDTHCATCHTSGCGDCHVSRPVASGAGFIDGHNFIKTPNSVLNCTACHGSRIEKEMLAKGPENLGLKPDVHWSPAGMQCASCHNYKWIHDPAQKAPDRYHVGEAPKCETCHVSKDGFYKNGMHAIHANPKASTPDLQCQVCHSQPYNNCYACHVGKDAKGLAFFKTDKSEFSFKIGKNPNPTAERPYAYVVVRHVPVAEDTFAYYGQGLLSRFASQPTWKYATPHNIVKQAPQAKDCNSCHGNPNLFLQAKDVLPSELKANEKVIVPAPPKKR